METPLELHKAECKDICDWAECPNCPAYRAPQDTQWDDLQKASEEMAEKYAIIVHNPLHPEERERASAEIKKILEAILVSERTRLATAVEGMVSDGDHAEYSEAILDVLNLIRHSPNK